MRLSHSLPELTVTDIGDLRSTASTKPAAAAGTITLGGDLTVNRMAFGAMRLTGRGIWGPPADHDECIRTLKRAVELGVNFIDTADSYGPHVSEELIAEALHPYPEGLVIATKGGFERTGPDKWVMNGRPEHLRTVLEGSLKRLKLDRIDLWQLHRIDPKVPESEQFDTIAGFVREGLVRHLGLSEVDVGAVERARKVVPVVSVQNKYNLIDRQWDDVVDHCERNHLAFIPWFPLDAGVIGSKSRGEDALERVASRHEATPRQVALAWLLARSPAMLIIPGTSKAKHVEENIMAAALELNDDDLRALG
ncbi:MAG TPA: aldo/keto reductase [Gemmatimonadaceae bacterium]